MVHEQAHTGVLSPGIFAFIGFSTETKPGLHRSSLPALLVLNPDGEPHDMRLFGKYMLASSPFPVVVQYVID